MSDKPKPAAPEVDLEQLIRNSSSHCASREAVADHETLVDAFRALIAETRAHRAKAAQLETCK